MQLCVLFICLGGEPVEAYTSHCVSVCPSVCISKLHFFTMLEKYVLKLVSQVEQNSLEKYFRFKDLL